MKTKKVVDKKMHSQTKLLCKSDIILTTGIHCHKYIGQSYKITDAKLASSPPTPHPKTARDKKAHKNMFRGNLSNEDLNE